MHQNKMLLPWLLSLLFFHLAQAQQNPENDSPNAYSVRLNPAIAGLLIAFICGFFFLGFFSVYLRRCGHTTSTQTTSTPPTALASSVLARRRGLDPAVLHTFPTMAYNEVKGVKAGKGALECAICLSEFDDEDVLRLLPGCSHVFHVDCIDVWLESKTTCPVCRANLAGEVAGGEERGDGEVETAAAEEMDLEIGRMEGAPAVGGDFRRWYSTGHAGEAVDRFTLRLPEEVRREIMGRGLRRAASLAEARPERRWFGRWGSVGGGGGPSGRWGFLLRTISGRRGAAAGPGERAGSKRVFPAVITESLGGPGSEGEKSGPVKDLGSGSVSADGEGRV